MNKTTTKQAIKAKAKSILRKYKKQESENYHSENLLLLAETCGTEEEIEHCQKRVDTMDWDHNGPRYEIPCYIGKKVNSYYYELVKLTK